MKRSLTYLLILLSSFLFAQNDTNFTKVQQIDLESGEVSTYDTNYHDIVDYINLFEDDIMFIHGKSGVYLPLTLEDNKWLTTSPFMFSPLSLPNSIYKTTVPFTQIEGMIGANTEEQLRFLHTQNIFHNWNVGLHYRFHRDESSYFAGTTRKWRTKLYSHYESTNGKYYNHFTFDVDQGKYKENFGVDSLNLLQDVIPSSELLGVDNQNAIHKLKNVKVNIDHRYRLSRDSSMNKWYLSQNFSFNQQSHVFEDEYPNLSAHLYNHFVSDTSFIFDSTKTQVIKLPLALELRNKNLVNQLGFSYNLQNFFSHDSVWVPHQYHYDQGEVFHHLKVNGNSLKFQTNNNYILYGMNRGNYNSENVISIEKVKWKYYLIGKISSKSVAPYWSRFNNANYDWDKQLNPESRFDFGFKLINKVFSVEANRVTISNYVYFNDTQLSQYNDQITYYKINLRTHINRPKWGIKGRFVYQNSSNFRLAIPDYIGKLWIYKKGSVFKGKMMFETGVMASYYSEYNAPLYIPNMAVFTPQTVYNFGNYPLIDLYLSGKVKNARFYLKGEHLNQGFTGYDYYTSLRNPMAGRTFKFGLILSLYN